MNVTVTCEGVTLDTYLISYVREDNICNSTSTVSIVLSINCPTVFDYYDVIVITEAGIKKGTYVLTSIEKSIPQGVINLNCSNTQKSLENHFITEKYDIMDMPTLKTRYWIEKFMTEAGVTYTITAAGDGEYLPNDLVLGGVMAIDAVKQLLQYSGWYMRYDENGVAIVGTLDYDSNAYSVEIQGSDIIDMKIEENDAMLRNRVVVWGMGSLLEGTNGWIFVDLSTTTPWNYDDNDKRTILISNSMISDSSIANTLAKKTLDEFTKPNVVKTIQVKGFVDVMVGDRIYVNSKYYAKICTVTTVYVGMEQSGVTTTLTLDERCPRLIGYFNFGGYVYVGTDGDGIWRKPLKYSDEWEDYSTGLTDLYITDLSIAGGVMSCVTANHYLFVRYPNDTQWNRVSSFTLHDEVDNVTYATINGEIVACSVDRNNGTVYAGIHYQISDSGYRSWVGKVVSPTQIVTTNIVTNSGNNYYLTDLDSNNYGVYIDAYTSVTISGVGGLPETPGYENAYEEDFVGWNFERDDVMDNHAWDFPASWLKWVPPYDTDYNHNATGILEDNILKITPTDMSNPEEYGWGKWRVSYPNIGFTATTKLIVGVNSWNTEYTSRVDLEWNTTPVGSRSSFNLALSTAYAEAKYGYDYYNKNLGPDYFEFAIPDTVKGLEEPLKEVAYFGGVRTNAGNFLGDPYVGLDFVGFTDAIIRDNEYPIPATPGIVVVSLANRLIEHKNDAFSIIAGAMAEYVDASQDLPVAVYGGDLLFNSGSLEVYVPPDRFNYVNLIYTNPSGIGESNYVYDFRSFSQLVPGSGYLRRSVFTRNTLVDGVSYLQLVDYDLVTIPDYIGYTIDGMWVPFDGTAKHLEVSNFGDNPYFFVSLEGSPSEFYQKDKYDNNQASTDFRDCSAGLPDSEVTIIRIDDLV